MKKILVVEDNDRHCQEILKQLKGLGDVVHVKSYRGAAKALRDEEFDLIVCDHNINMFEDDPNSWGQGTDVYFHLRFMTDKDDVMFIHYSSEPCPEKYDAEDDKLFKSFHKVVGFDLRKEVLELFKDRN